MRPRQPSSTELRLMRENDGLRTTIVCLRREIENKQGSISRLETLLRERLTRIDQLTAQVDQLRSQNKRLNEENEHLARLIATSPDNASSPLPNDHHTLATDVKDHQSLAQS
jgi:septal ring factor EnvC (AmiA/AmiB activator)